MKIFFIVLALLCASTQAAADVQVDLPSHVEIEKQSDLSAAMIKNLLGDVFDDVGGKIDNVLDWENPFAGLIVAVLSALNLAALTYLTALILYMWCIFTVNTAHDGKKLGGGQYNSLWVPVRHATAFALTVPVLKGLSLLQVAIIASITLGINFANTVWDASAKYIFETTQNLISLTSNTVADEAYNFLPMMFSGTVVQTLDELQRPEYWDDVPETSDTIIRASRYYIVEKKNDRIAIYARTTKYSDQNLLGSISFAYPSGSDTKSELQRQIVDARIEAVLKLWDGMREHARQYVVSKDATQSDVRFAQLDTSPTNYKALIREYVNSVDEKAKTAAEEFLKDDNSIKSKIRRALDYDGEKTTKGWFIAGTHYLALALLQMSIDDLLLAQSDYTTVDVKSVNKATTSEILDSMSGAMSFGWAPSARTIFGNSGTYFASKVLKNYSYSAVTQSDADAGGLSGWVQKLASKLVLDGNSAGADVAQTGILASVLEQFSTRDPFVVIVAMGNRMLSAGYWAFGTSGLTTLAGSFLSKVPGASGVAGMISGAAFTIGIAIFLCGIAMAFICPIIPFLFWIRALVTWIFLVAECLVAAPFWSCVHALPRGEGFAGDAARKGYLLLIEVAIRPVLLVAGAVVAIAIIKVCGKLYHTMFSLWFVVNGEYLGMGLTANIVFSIVVIASMYTLIHIVFTKGVTFLPERVMKWIGSVGGSSLGDEGDAGQQSGRVVAMAGQHVSQVGSGVLNRAGSPGLPGTPGREAAKAVAGKNGEIGPGIAALPPASPKGGGGGGGGHGAAAKPSRRGSTGSAGEGILSNAGLGESQGQSPSLGQGSGQGGGSGATPASPATSTPASTTAGAGTGSGLGQGIADASAPAAESGQGQGKGKGKEKGQDRRSSFENMLWRNS